MKFDSLIEILDGFHAARVLVLGDVMLDRFVYGSVERISPEAPIPVVSIERRSDMPGGAANVARNIAAMGARVTLLGAVGADASARDLHAQLTLSPTIDAHLIVDASRPTSVKTRYVADGQQVMRADCESRHWLTGAAEASLLERFSAALNEAHVVILSDYAKGVLSDSIAAAAIRIARAAGKPVIVDPKSKDFEKYRGATLITPNRLELQTVCGFSCDCDAAVAAGASSILRQGLCDAVIVTRGKDGMSVIHADGAVIHLPTAARQVFDVSGAGDTVVAALALGMAAGADLEDAATLASSAAGIVRRQARHSDRDDGRDRRRTASQRRPFRPAKKYILWKPLCSCAEHGANRACRSLLPMAASTCCIRGHVALLEQARQCADRLLVALNSDLSIRRLKGANRPVQSEVARATVLGAMKTVDAVVIFSEDTPLHLIEMLEPDVLVKGADYSVEKVVGADFVLKRGGRVVLAKLLSGS